MGLFGGKRKKPMAGQEQQAMAEEPKTDWGNVARNVVGHVGDAVAQHYGGAPVFGPLQRQAQFFQQQGALLAERQRQQAAMQAQRAADQKAMYDYRLANPMPTALERNTEAYMGFNPEQRAAYREMNPEQNIVVPLPDGRTYVGPNSGLEGAMTGRPSQAKRPEGMSDGDLYARGQRAIQQGADPKEVFKRLKEMGVRDPAGI